jgi:hypothetical protein
MRKVVLIQSKTGFELESFPERETIYCPRTVCEDGEDVHCGDRCPFFEMLPQYDEVRLYCTGSLYLLKLATEAELKEAVEKEAKERR